MIECFGICSENCSAFQNGKCILDAKKAETKNDFELYEEDKIGIKGNKGKRMDESAFDNYVCGVTENTCCGCSLYCEHRRPKTEAQMKEKNYLKSMCDPICQGCFLAKDTPLDFKDCEKCRKLFEEHPEMFKER